MTRSKKIEKNFKTLQYLAKANKKVQKTLLTNASKDLISTLIHCIRLILKGNVRFTKRQLMALRPYERMIKQFIAKHTSLAKKRQILQKGGFIGLLLKPLLKTVVPSLIGGILGNN